MNKENTNGMSKEAIEKVQRWMTGWEVWSHDPSKGKMVYDRLLAYEKHLCAEEAKLKLTAQPVE